MHGVLASLLIFALLREILIVTSAIINNKPLSHGRWVIFRNTISVLSVLFVVLSAILVAVIVATYSYLLWLLLFFLLLL